MGIQRCTSTRKNSKEVTMTFPSVQSEEPVKDPNKMAIEELSDK